MTATLHRPPTGPSRDRRPDPLRAGIPAALWAFFAGLVAVAIPVLLGWAADSRSGASAQAALATVGQVFLYAQGTSLRVPGGELDLVPLGLTVLPMLLLARAGRHAAGRYAVRTLADAGRLTLAIAFPYATLAGFLAAVSGTKAVEPAPVQALIGGFVVASLAAGAGVLRGADLGSALPAALPARLVVAGRAATVVLVGLLGMGALLVGVSLAMHAGRATDLADATGPGIVGALLLLAIGIALVPVAAVWGACWWIGPGFAVGVGTSVGPLGTDLGPVPAVPILAALPGSSPPTLLGVLALAVPVALGLLGGVLVRRHEGDWRDAALVGPLVGLLMVALCVLTAGPVGGQRLTEVGPTAWLVGIVVTLEVGLAAMAWVSASTYLRSRSKASRQSF